LRRRLRFGVAIALFAAPLAALPTSAQLIVDSGARSISFPAEVQADRFLASLPPEHQYHALVSRDGSAVESALFVTDVSDVDIARALRDLGAEDAGGVPMSAWRLRWLPLVPQPASRVQGTPIQVTVSWDESPGGRPLGELLSDPGGRGVEMRFGGNEDQNHHWDSGCILCLFSCPGGVVSNAAYSIRDHQRGVTSFGPEQTLPPDGTRVTITLTLAPP